MQNVNEENIFCLSLYSQGDWCSPEKLFKLIEVMTDKYLGNPDYFNLGRKSKRSFAEFDCDAVSEKLLAGKTDSLDIGGALPQPYSGMLILSRNFAYNKDGILMGTHLFGMERYMTIPGNHGKDLNPLLSLLTTSAHPLEIRYGFITRLSQEKKSYRRYKKWISPQYIRAVARVMLFGPKEVERFDREVLLAAPAHQVRELSPGYILIITSPDSLDADAPEDEKALDALADYLFAQPKVSVLM